MMKRVEGYLRWPSEENWAAKTASCPSTQEYYGIIENNKSPEDEPELIAGAIASNLRHWLQLRWEPSWENLSDGWRKGTVSRPLSLFLLTSFSSFFLFRSAASNFSLSFSLSLHLEHGFESTLYGAINSLRRVAFLAPSRHGKGICKREDSRTSHRESDGWIEREDTGRKKQRRGGTVANEDEGR